MNITYFIRENKPIWSELEQMLPLFEKKRSSIRSTQIDRLLVLYKKASTHLAYAQTYFADNELCLYLNDLVSRAHHAVYREQWKSTHRIGHFFKHQFIAAILASKWFIAAAMALFISGGLFGFIAVWSNPSHLYAVIPAQIADNIDPSRVGEGHDQIQNGLMSTQIMINNIRVAILAFVSGITLGILTVYLMFYNGILIGALAAFFWQAGQSYTFWAYILPHGIIELTAIFIAGGAGLYMGYRLIAPGSFSRKHHFVHAVKQSALLMIGTIPLFVIAGIIEGYITPSPLSLELKYGVAGITLLLFGLYIAYGRIQQDPPHLQAATAHPALAYRDND